MSLLNLFKPRWKHSDPTIRRKALKKVTDKKVLNEIVINDENEDVRKAALDKVTDQGVLKEIIMKDNNADIRKTALEKVTDQRVLSKIVKHNKNADIRKAALEKVTDKKVLSEIAKYHDGFSDVSKAVIEKITDKKVLSSIAKFNKNEEVRKAALEKVTAQKVLASIAQNDESAEVRKAALEKVTDQVVLSSIAQNAKNEDVRKAAVKKQKKDVSGFIKALKNKDPEVRKDSVWALGFIGDTQAFEPLLESLNDDDVIVRYSALDALQKLDAKKAIEPIIQTMLHDKKREVRCEAARILGKMKDPRAVEPLFNALRDKFVGQYAATALGEIEDERALDFLCKALQKDFSSEVQLRIALTLIETGEKKAIEPLIQYLKDKDEKIYEAILQKFSDLSHWEDWKGKKNRMFHSVYKVIADRLNIPSDKEPIEIIYEGRNINKLIDKLCSVAIPQTPLLTQSQIKSESKPIQKSWKSALHNGTVEDLVNALRPKLESDFVDRQFYQFSARIYYPQKCAQVESRFWGTFKGYRIWRADEQLFFCFSIE